MIEALYWWDKAAEYKHEALTSADMDQRTELLELAETCEAVAIDVEDRATGG
jgi:hypothetical protein